METIIVELDSVDYNDSGSVVDMLTEGLGPGYDIKGDVHHSQSANYCANATLSSSVANHDLGFKISPIVGISIMFCIIGVIGIVGNTLIIFIIVLDKKMRNSVTNLFIMNLAISDLFIMLFGVPEVVQFILNKGWLLGEIMCRIERYALVISLYSSVLTAVAVCIERYIAIVHPMKAHLLCSRRRMGLVIALVWPAVFALGLPVLLYNCLQNPAPPTASLNGTQALHDLKGSQPISQVFCRLHFPDNHFQYFVPYKYMEFVLFYMVPMILQIACYSIIGKHLFAGSQELHRRRIVWGGDGSSGGQKEAMSEALKARKGVVKMLMASVIIYFVSYSPHQILLFYNTFSHAPFHQTWVFLVFVTAMGYVNSAANPILYCIFSQKFRSKFKTIMCCLRTDKEPKTMMTNSHYASVTDSGVVMSSFKRSSRSTLQPYRENSVDAKKTYGAVSNKKTTWL